MASWGDAAPARRSQGAIEAPLQIRRKLRLMLVIGHLAVVSEDAMEDLLGFEGIQHWLQGVIHRQHMGDGTAVASGSTILPSSARSGSRSSSVFSAPENEAL